MPEKTPQTLQNHAKMVAPFHYILLPILLINLLLSIYRSTTAFSLETDWLVWIGGSVDHDRYVRTDIRVKSPRPSHSTRGTNADANASPRRIKTAHP